MKEPENDPRTFLAELVGNVYEAKNNFYKSHANDNGPPKPITQKDIEEVYGFLDDLADGLQRLRKENTQLDPTGQTYPVEQVDVDAVFDFVSETAARASQLVRPKRLSE